MERRECPNAIRETERFRVGSRVVVKDRVYLRCGDCGKYHLVSDSDSVSFGEGYQAGDSLTSHSHEWRLAKEVSFGQSNSLGECVPIR